MQESRRSKNENLHLETIRTIEFNALSKIFGRKFEVASPQQDLVGIPERSLNDASVQCMYFPYLDLSLPPNISRETSHGFLESVKTALKKRYPNWNMLDEIDEYLGKNHNKTYMPQNHYWEDLRKEITSPPSMNNHWMLVENIQKPDRQQPYPDSPITDMLGLNSRYQTWQSISDSLRSPRFQRKSNDYFKIPNLIWRLPTLFELNIIANRLMTKSTSSIYEWTCTEVTRPDIYTHEPITNYYQLGGAHTNLSNNVAGWSPAMVDLDPPTYKGFHSIAFRLVGELQSSN